MKKPTDRAHLLRIAGTLLAIALLIYLLSRQGWQSILDATRQIPLGILAACFGLVMISRLAVALRWHVLLRASGLAIPLWQSVQITFAGLFASNFLPTTVGGDVVRLAGAVRLKHDSAAVTASLIADRLVGMLGMALTVPLGLPAFLGSLRQSGSARLPGFSLAALTYPAKGGVAWESLKSKISRFLTHLNQSLKVYLKRPTSLLAALLFSGLHMGCIFTVLYLLFKYEGQSIGWGLVAGLNSLVYFITLLPVSINGYGLQELSMTLIYSRAGSVSLESSLSVALLLRTLMLLASLPGSLTISTILAGTRNDDVK